MLSKEEVITPATHPQSEVAEKLPGKFGELPGKSGDFPEARGSLTPSQRLAKFVSKQFLISQEFKSAKSKRGRREGDGKKNVTTICDKRHDNLRHVTTICDIL